MGWHPTRVLNDEPCCSNGLNTKPQRGKKYLNKSATLLCCIKIWTSPVTQEQQISVWNAWNHILVWGRLPGKRPCSNTNTNPYYFSQKSIQFWTLTCSFDENFNKLLSRHIFEWWTTVRSLIYSKQVWVLRVIYTHSEHSSACAAVRYTSVVSSSIFLTSALLSIFTFSLELSTSAMFYAILHVPVGQHCHHAFSTAHLLPLPSSLSPSIAVQPSSRLNRPFPPFGQLSHRQS